MQLWVRTVLKCLSISCLQVELWSHGKGQSETAPGDIMPLHKPGLKPSLQELLHNTKAVPVFIRAVPPTLPSLGRLGQELQRQPYGHAGHKCETLEALSPSANSKSQG